MRDAGVNPVRFGISLPNRAVLFGVSPNLLLETAEMADCSGFFDSVWVGDNLLSKPRLESIVTLAALAARTERVKLGEVCLASFPLRHPLILAIQWASLDVISGGRTILVVCIGGSARMGPRFAAELAAMGVGSNERVPRLEEGIALLRAFWGQEPVTHEGRFYQFEGSRRSRSRFRPRSRSRSRPTRSRAATRPSRSVPCAGSPASPTAGRLTARRRPSSASAGTAFGSTPPRKAAPTG